LNLDAVGTLGAPTERSWSKREVQLYAVAVGAGADDATTELQFTTENTRNVELQALPTYGVVLGMGGGTALRNLGTFNPAMLVHAEQSIEWHQVLQPEGTVTLTGTLVDIVDKRSGALIVTENRAVDPETGDPVFTARSGLFIRGEGGFASDQGAGAAGPHSAPAPEIPAREPDHQVSYRTTRNQAILYRLCGDRNPLHSDPAFAAAGGFDRPILHGLCTYGFTGRALLHALAGSEPARLRSMSGRFSRPVLPGQTLTVSMWTEGSGAAVFRTTTDDGTVVIDRGRCTFA
jgi:acyl dehydratase